MPERELPLPEIPSQEVQENMVIVVFITQIYTRVYKLTGLEKSPRGFRPTTTISVQQFSCVTDETTYLRYGRNFYNEIKIQSTLLRVRYLLA